jgi:hypothetical protein
MKSLNSVLNSTALQGVYLAALIAGVAGLLGITGRVHSFFQDAYRDPRMEALQCVTGLACLGAFKLRNATFKAFVFFAERRLAFMDRRSGVVSSLYLSEESGFNLAELDSISGLYNFLNRLHRRIERRQNYVAVFPAPPIGVNSFGRIASRKRWVMNHAVL